MATIKVLLDVFSLHLQMQGQKPIIKLHEVKTKRLCREPQPNPTLEMSERTQNATNIQHSSHNTQ